MLLLLCHLQPCDPSSPAHLIHFNKFCNISALWISSSQDQGSSGSRREEVAGAWSEEGRRNHFNSKCLSDLFSSNTKLLSGSLSQADRVFQREKDWCSLHERNGGFQINLKQGQAGIVTEESPWLSLLPKCCPKFHHPVLCLHSQGDKEWKKTGWKTAQQNTPTAQWFQTQMCVNA